MSEPKRKYAVKKSDWDAMVARANKIIYCKKCGKPKLHLANTDTHHDPCTCAPEPAPAKPTPTLTALDLAVIIDALGVAATSPYDNRYHYVRSQHEKTCDVVIALAASLNVTITLETEDETKEPTD